MIIDRDTASRLGLSQQAIDNALYDSFGQRHVSTMYTALNQYYVVMEVDPRYQQDPDSLKRDVRALLHRGGGADELVRPASVRPTRLLR